MRAAKCIQRIQPNLKTLTQKRFLSYQKQNVVEGANRGKKFYWFAVFPAIAFGLGSWQLMRMQTKKKLIDNANTSMAQPPVESPENLCSNEFDWKKYQFQRVALNGHFLQGLSMPVGPRSKEGIDGYQVISPFKLENGGWISKANYNKSWTESTTPVTVVGYFRSPVETGSSFTPENKPQENVWFAIDSYQMAQLVQASPVLINAVNETNSPVKMMKFSPNAADMIFNRHLEYVLTWYSLSGLLSCLTWYLIKHPPRII